MDRYEEKAKAVVIQIRRHHDLCKVLSFDEAAAEVIAVQLRTAADEREAETVEKACAAVCFFCREGAADNDELSCRQVGIMEDGSDLCPQWVHTGRDYMNIKCSADAIRRAFAKEGP